MVPSLTTIELAVAESVNGFAPARWLLDHHTELARAGLYELANEAVEGGALEVPDVNLFGEMLYAVARRLAEPRVLVQIGRSAEVAFDESFALLLRGAVARALRAA
jgi:hypothetical protein